MSQSVPIKTILEAGRSEKNYWRDLWHYRELFQVQQGTLRGNLRSQA